MAGGSGWRSRYWDLAALIVIATIAGWLFRDHLSGAMTFLGNPDRLNHSLKVLAFFVDGISHGDLHAWNEVEMLGYDAYVLPYTFPSPVAYAVAASGAQNVILAAGYVSFVLLACAGWSAYAFARQFAPAPLALVAALLYQCSALSILKVAQNDLSFAVIVALPLIGLVIRRASSANPAWSYANSALLVFVLLQFCFIQKAAYALIFAAVYALYLQWEHRRTVATVALAAGAATGILAAAPRLISLAETMREYVRIQPGETIRNFADLFRYQGVKPYDILRWFEDGLFGRYFSDAAARTNYINLTEGFLLYTSAFAPFLVIVAMIVNSPRWRGTLVGRPNEMRFFLWFLILACAVALIQPVNYVFHLLFARIDFVHARFLVAGLLPLVMYLTLYLRALKPDLPPSPRAAATGMAVALAVTGGIEVIAASYTGTWQWNPNWFEGRVLDRSATARVAASAVACLALAAGLGFSRAPFVRYSAYVALCGCIALQALIGADFRMNGAHTRSGDVAFRNGDFYFASRDDFIPPTDAQRAALHRKVERDAYRSVVVCDAASAGGFCAGHVGQFWRLRLADGYYGTGVPARVALLPWPSGLGLRHIVFTSTDQLPWPLLGLLNVKYALLNDVHLYRNRNLAAEAPWPKVASNPARVVPRAFFAAAVQAVRSPVEAKALLFTGAGIGDPAALSFVEGEFRQTPLGHDGAIRLESSGDNVEIQLDAARTERFLVINELFTPRWSAFVDGVATGIYPANVVMRGLFVPAGATRVVLTYTPAVHTPLAYACWVAALLLCAALFYAFRKRASARRCDGSDPSFHRITS